MWLWEVVWLVPLVAVIGGFITKWHSTNARVELARAGSADAMQELRDVVLRLEQRVANLERAVMTAEEQRKYAL
jgi:outer membrane protein TolC